MQIASLHKKITVTTVYSRRIFFLLKLLMRIQYINFFYIMEKKKNLRNQQKKEKKQKKSQKLTQL